MHLIKTSFILALVVFLMPSPPELEQLPVSTGSQATPSHVDLVSAASDAVADVSSFCYRQPGVCTTAGYLMRKLEVKARYGVRLIYEWANEDPTLTDLPRGYANQAVLVDPLITSSTGKVAANEGSPASQSSLKVEDLIPAWHGPPPRQAS